MQIRILLDHNDAYMICAFSRSRVFRSERIINETPYHGPLETEDEVTNPPSPIGAKVQKDNSTAPIGTNVIEGNPPASNWTNVIEGNPVETIAMAREEAPDFPGKFWVSSNPPLLDSWPDDYPDR